MSGRRFILADLQVEIQNRRKALVEQGVVLPTDEQLRNKGGRRTPEKQQLLQRMTEAAQAAGLVPTRRHI
jgi:hypothetical protein